MAIFTIKVWAAENAAPTVGDASATLSSKTYTFTTANFTTGYSDPDGDNYKNVIINSLTGVAKLMLLGQDAKIGDFFLADNASGLKFVLQDQYAIYGGTVYDFGRSIDTIIAEYDSLGYKLTTNAAGTLTFTNQSDQSDVIQITGEAVVNSELQFDFSVTDVNDNESNIATFSLLPSGDINVKATYVNNPPIVGDNTLQTSYDTTLSLVQSDFIDDTDPRFSDPEGDEPYQLKILSLPSNGTLQVNGVDAVVDQILNFGTDITQDPNTTLFKYIPDNTRTDINDVTFRFAVSDTGSQTFVE